ncbi:STAS domain-containing protein [Streptomyces sp. RB6PN25]|uniref:Anti-sigma factor antagonist n=1 Tax=Streptomyces humicola TaxID=2953240 RepID=A0ABT1Q4F3_9ACTN|nr:STAS domain-containing protein [Streptomyces humicola]MCQ4083660.1 STAS domain-containing protein [Streptomyces humicola]
MTAAEGGLGTAVSSDGGQVTVTISGEIDVSTGPCLKQALQAALDRRPGRIVVDFTRVEFCDCCGLGVLLGGRRQARRAGIDFQVTGVAAPTVVKLIRLFGLAEVLGVQRPQGGPA